MREHSMEAGIRKNYEEVDRYGAAMAEGIQASTVNHHDSSNETDQEQRIQKIIRKQRRNINIVVVWRSLEKKTEIEKEQQETNRYNLCYYGYSGVLRNQCSEVTE